ncbi:MAG: hypothetical protein WBD20_16220 [Pirellulaceae bacterium]
MKPATVSELKKQLVLLDHDDLLDACLRLAKFKADNKSLLTYLLLKSHDELQYANEVCDEINEMLAESKTLHRKTLRRIVRWFEKQIRYSGDKETELQIRIHFCRSLIQTRFDYSRCRVTSNLFASQVRKIEKSIDKVHPDLQYDFRVQMEGFDRVGR